MVLTMPRTSRLDIPGLLYHVTARGVERRDIYLDDDDRSSFLDRFSSLLQETGTECLAWALMSNHFHLLIRPHHTRLATFMRRLLTGYAVSFNRRHTRSGHLFQNRYHSVICEEDAYLLELVRYIHLNPVKVGLVAGLEQLDTYPLTGHAVLMGNRSFVGQNVEPVLAQFARTKNAAISKYRKFIQDGLNADAAEGKAVSGVKQLIKSLHQKNTELVDDQRILGSFSFAAELKRNIGDIQTPAVRLTELLARVAKVYKVNPDTLSGRGRTRALSDARALFCHLAFNQLHHNGAALARMLNVSRSAVCLAVRRGEGLIKERPELVDVLNDNLTS
jgi:REP-associated tyrosine transposase